VYSLLRDILLHYIFGYLDDKEDMMRASRCLWDLAKLLENHFVRSKVSLKCCVLSNKFWMDTHTAPAGF
jgi:hypothetical protein